MTPGTRSIEQLKIHLDALVSGFPEGTFGEEWCAEQHVAIDELAELREQVAKQEAALRPFAEMWELALRESEAARLNNEWVDRRADGEVGASVTVTWGELRAAARALSPAETQEAK